MTDLHELAENLRRMGEPESSVEYLTRPQSNLLAVFGDALRPSIEPLNPPRIDTGD